MMSDEVTTTGIYQNSREISSYVMDTNLVAGQFLSYKLDTSIPSDHLSSGFTVIKDLSLDKILFIRSGLVGSELHT